MSIAPTRASANGPYYSEVLCVGNPKGFNGMFPVFNKARRQGAEAAREWLKRMQGMTPYFDAIGDDFIAIDAAIRMALSEGTSGEEDFRAGFLSALAEFALRVMLYGEPSADTWSPTETYTASKLRAVRERVRKDIDDMCN